VAEVVLFHSVLGIRQGVLDAAARLESMGHVVHVADLYGGGTVFDDYGEASKHVESMGGVPELLRRTREAARSLPERLVYGGFSNGGVAAEYLAATRPGALGAVLFAAGIPLEMFARVEGEEISAWPTGVPVQVHYTVDDPFRDPVDGLQASVEAAGASFTLYEYPGSGHLFTDRTMVDEYDESATQLLWTRVAGFLADL
jgi:dienelactone hydrolase